MANLDKQPGTIRLPKSSWDLLDAIRSQEGWTKSVAVMELIKFYAKEHNITVTEESDNEGN